MKYFIQGFPGGSDGKESACNAEDLGSSPGLGRFLGEVNGYPLYYAFLENSINFCPKNIHHHLADVEFFFFMFKTLFFPDYRTSESSLPQPERQCLLTAQIWCTDTLYKAPVLSHTTRGQEQRE